MTQTLFTNIAELVQPWDRAGKSDHPLDKITNAALWVVDGRVKRVGEATAIAEEVPPSVPRVDLGGRAVVPGLVDSHTHLVFAGERIDELSLRSRGASYESIAQSGGGIASTVAKQQSANEDELVARAAPRLLQLLAHGTTTCEIKSGYGLTLEAEFTQLRAISRLKETAAVDVRPTLLAHLVPREYATERHDYVEMFCRELLVEAHRLGLASYCDVFVERTAFSKDEAKRIAQAAGELGLPLKLHVDQLHDGGGAALAAELRALSADHLECTNDSGARALAEAGVVATVLPGCALFLGTVFPDARKLRQAGCEVAVATDCNPGSSMVFDLPLCAALASSQCNLTLEESLWGVTRGGARALGLHDRGRLVENERADFVVIDHSDWRALFYRIGAPPIHSVYIEGNRSY